jgi:hypothetical protein
LWCSKRWRPLLAVAIASLISDHGGTTGETLPHLWPISSTKRVQILFRLQQAGGRVNDMSMYSQLLDAAFDAGAPDVGGSRTAHLSDLLVCRTQRQDKVRVKGQNAVGPSALASQVAYDLALIRLARSVGLPCQPDDFSQPELQRRQLHQALASQGIHLNETDEYAHAIS